MRVRDSCALCLTCSSGPDAVWATLRHRMIGESYSVDVVCNAERGTMIDGRACSSMVFALRRTRGLRRFQRQTELTVELRRKEERENGQEMRPKKRKEVRVLVG